MSQYFFEESQAIQVPASSAEHHYMWDRTSALPIYAGGMTDVDIFRNALNAKTHTHKAPLAVPGKALPSQDGASDSV